MGDIEARAAHPERAGVAGAPRQTIASVAFAAGFESRSHLHTTFRSLVGIVPKCLLGKQ